MERRELKVHQAPQVSKEIMAILELMVCKVHQVLLLPVVVEWSIPGGEGQPAYPHQELNWSMQEELEEAGTAIVEGEPITCACLMTHSI